MPRPHAIGLAALAALLALGLANTHSVSAESPTTITVAPDGSGDAATIAAAVAIASDGDTVAVGPGTFVEDIELTRAIRLRGAAPAGSTIVRSASGGPAIHVLDADVVLSDLTLVGEGSSIIVSGGAPVIERIRMRGVQARRGTNLPRLAIQLEGATRAIVRDNELEGSGEIRVVGDASPTITDNTLRDGHGIALEGVAPGVVVRGNLIVGAFTHGIAVHSGDPLVVGNIIRRAESNGISVGRSRPVVGRAVVRDNTVSGSSFGISVANFAEPIVSGNTLRGNDVGISTAVSDATISGNVIRDGGVGIVVVRHAPRLDDNIVEGNVIGVLVELATDPVMRGNRICGNVTDLRLLAGADAPDVSADRACP